MMTVSVFPVSGTAASAGSAADAAADPDSASNRRRNSRRGNTRGAVVLVIVPPLEFSSRDGYLRFDLHRDIEWQLRHPNRRSRMRAAIGTVHVEDQIRKTVDDRR